MWDLFKDTEGFVGPVLLIIIGGLFRLAQTQIQDRRKAREAAQAERAAREERERKEREEREDREENQRREAQRLADDVRKAAETAAKEERERSQRELDREREDRKRESDRAQKSIDDMVHHLKTKMQSYENMQGVHEKQIRMLEQQNEMLEEKVKEREATIERLKRRLRKHEPLGDDE